MRRQFRGTVPAGTGPRTMPRRRPPQDRPGNPAAACRRRSIRVRRGTEADPTVFRVLTSTEPIAVRCSHTSRAGCSATVSEHECDRGPEQQHTCHRGGHPHRQTGLQVDATRGPVPTALVTRAACAATRRLARSVRLRRRSVLRPQGNERLQQVGLPGLQTRPALECSVPLSFALTGWSRFSTTRAGGVSRGACDGAQAGTGTGSHRSRDVELMRSLFDIAGPVSCDRLDSPAFLDG